MISQSGKDGRFGDPFVDLQVTVRNKMRRVHALVDGMHGVDQGQGIKDSAEIRKLLSEIEGYVVEMQTMIRQELKKRRSRLSASELEQRQTDIAGIERELESVKEHQRMGYLRGIVLAPGQPKREAVSYSSLKSTDIGSGQGISHTEAMTSAQQKQLMALKERDDTEMAVEMGAIEEGVLSLRQVALTQNAEVKTQSQMLDGMDTRFDGAHDKVAANRHTLKTEMKKARAADKFCVDLICFGITIVLVIVIYKITENW